MDRGFLQGSQRYIKCGRDLEKIFQFGGIMIKNFFLGGVIICVIILTMVTSLTSVDSFFDSGLPNSVRGLTVDLFLS